MLQKEHFSWENTNTFLGKDKKSTEGSLETADF